MENALYKFFKLLLLLPSRSCSCEGKITVDLYVFQETFVLASLLPDKTIEEYTSLES